MMSALIVENHEILFKNLRFIARIRPVLVIIQFASIGLDQSTLDCHRSPDFTSQFFLPDGHPSESVFGANQPVCVYPAPEIAKRGTKVTR